MDEEQGCGCREFCEEIKSGCAAVRNYDCAGCCKNTFTGAAVKRKLPILQWAPNYSLGDLQGDVIAGLTVGLTVIPQGLAYAVIAGLPPQYGLYSAFMGCFIYCLLGTSKDITLGPTAIMSLMTAAFATSPIQQDPTIAIVLTLSCGVVQFLMGLLHLGCLVNFISFPVISGFTTAAAITIACGQVKKWLGLHNIPRDFIPQMIQTFKHIKETCIGDMVLGLIVMIILVLMKKMKDVKWNIDENTGMGKKVATKTLWLIGTARNALVILTATIIVFFVDKSGHDWFTMTGNITAGLPSFKPPQFHINDTHNGTVIEWGPADIFKTIGTGLIIVPILGLVEAIAIGKAFARKNNYNIDANQELLAIGLSNIVGCFVQSYPVTGSFSRTAVNSQSGVRTPAGGIVTGSVVLLALGLLTRYFYYIPQAALAGLIIVAVLDMVDFKVVAKLWRVKRIDVLPWFATFLCSFIIGIEYGILVGIAVSIALLLYPWARPSIQIQDEYFDHVAPEDSTAAAESSHHHHPSKVVRLETGLGFPGVEYVKQLVMEACTNDGDCPRTIVLDCSHIFSMDYTSVQGLGQLISDLAARNVTLLLSHVQPSVLEVIRRAKVKNIKLSDSNKEAEGLLNSYQNPDDERESLLPRSYGAISPSRNREDSGSVQNHS